MPEIKIVPFCVEHLEEVINIETQWNPISWSKKLFENELSNPISICCVAISCQQVVGYAIAHAVFEELQIVSIAVEQEHRNQGIGKQLLKFLIEQTTEKSVLKILLEVRQSNLNARVFYKSIGFEETGVRKNYYFDNGEDAIIMSMNLIK